ncbi:gp4a [Streptomyces phage phiBT1]|uniref:Gp4a n=1 Tax=Lomovskayavirus BT1 TaxID=225588 RepID=Q858Z7_9CAUD|nr:gp4a [Streptomyces phage phiBT1]CAD80128.1 gp4a [Lomovskayavirus BT1]
MSAATPEAWALVMRGASDEAVRAPLWQYPPEGRRAVLSERARRFGTPTADDFDPEYH